VQNSIGFGFRIRHIPTGYRPYSIVKIHTYMVADPAQNDSHFGLYILSKV